MNDGLYHEDKIIRNIGNELIDQFQKSGVTPGTNGPYNDQETIVRNLSHLIVITSIEIIKYGRDELKILLINMAKVLIKEEFENGVYILRNKENKDCSNGVIGHAWVIEAFIYLYKALHEKEYINRAVQIYNNHKFDDNLGLWKRPSIETQNNMIDYTLNHQLWFAGVSSEILKYSEYKSIAKDFDIFFAKLSKNITIDSKGLVCHSLVKKKSFIGTRKSQVKRSNDLIRRRIGKPSYYYKEVGYHIFNVAALARLFVVFPNHQFWSSKKFKKIIEKTNSISLFEEYQKSNIELDVSLNNDIREKSEKDINIYGFPYNVPGFEMYYIKTIFGDRIDESMYRNYLQKQLELTYDRKKNRFEKKCFDKTTINYRIYEYYKAMEVR